MAEDRTLDEAQALISEKYLGQAGIHGVGIRRSKSAIAVYVDPGTTQQHEQFLAKIEQEIQPFSLMIVEEGKASIR